MRIYLHIYSNVQDTDTGKFIIEDILNPIDFCVNSTYDNTTNIISFDRTGEETGITTANVVGEVTIICVDKNSEGLDLYVNNFIKNDEYKIYNLEQAFSIISIGGENNNTITGYVDLKLDDNSNSSIWKNNEAPLIFETDYNYVANTTDAYENFNLEYSCVVPCISESYDSGEHIISFSSNYDAPRDKNSIICLSDNNGKVYNPYDYEIYEEQNIGTEGTFQIIFTNKSVAPTIAEDFTIYYITDIDFSERNYLKYKTLTISKDTIIGSNITDDIELEKYDLITLLSIKKYTGNTSGISNSTGEEILYDSEEGMSLSSMSNYITLDTGSTDYCYKKSRVKGIESYLKMQYGTVQNGVTNINVSQIEITYAYFEHTKGAGFYSAFSYNVDGELIEKSIDVATSSNLSDEGSLLNSSTNILKNRLYNYFGISGIYKSYNEYAGVHVLGSNVLTNTTTSVASDSYKIIPVYKSSTGSQYNLANCIDFRPDYIANSPTLFPLIPKPSSRIEYDIALYLPRIDNVWIDKTGNFGITNGIPAEEPFAPSEIDGSMVLYRLYNRPYGKTIEDIIPTYIDNKRHTMKDISKLSERITALEEVVSMSLIEQSAINMQITDDDGVTRYKCGIFTDTFSNFNNCNIDSEEWSASIDSVEKSIRPYFVTVDWSISPIGEYTIPNSSNGESATYTSGFKLKDETSLYNPSLSDSITSKLNEVICWNNSIITLKPLDLSNISSNSNYASLRETNLTFTQRT